jgi:hypothetical protein
MRPLSEEPERMKEQGCCGNVVTSRNPLSNVGSNWKGEMVIEMKRLASLSAGETL